MAYIYKTILRYCHRTVPILVVFPIDLKCEDEENEANAFDRVWKTEAKNGLGGNVLLAFAYGFPGTDSKVMVRYRANAVMIDQLTAGIDLNDEDEGVEDTDD